MVRQTAMWIQHITRNRDPFKTSSNHVKALVSSIEELDNPFSEESEDLLVLDTKEIGSPEAVCTLQEIREIGQKQCDAFIQECLVKRTKSLYEPIKNNKLQLFSTPAFKISKSSQQISSLKSNCALFARLYISCQSRDRNPDEFFKVSMKIKLVHLLYLTWENYAYQRRSQSWQSAPR